MIALLAATLALAADPAPEASPAEDAAREARHLRHIRQVTSGGDLLAAVGSGQLTFAAVERFPAERAIRVHGATAVVVGRTRMDIRFGPDQVSASSRYTHVYVRAEADWRLLSAQGTPIAG